MITVDRLGFRKTSGAGMVIDAHIDADVNCVEFTMKSGRQTVLIGTDPWVQFPPNEWDTMIERVLGEMVEAWNEKHAGGGP